MKEKLLAAGILMEAGLAVVAGWEWLMTGNQAYLVMVVVCLVSALMISRV